MRRLVLRAASLRAEIVPEFGAALSRFDVITGSPGLPALRSVPVLRGFDGAAAPRPGQLACFPLLPWSNRLDGGFAFEGRRYAIAPNRDDDPYPMHGHGWQRAWDVAEQSDTRAVLTLDCADIPFAYHAQITYALNASALDVTLDIVNRGETALPFGLGLHPWLPRSAGVTLEARARAVWLCGENKLPRERAAIPDDWSFARAHALPAELVDHVFEGWDGRAEIRWPETGLSLRIEADCDYYILYAPPGKDFFCFEPVDHRIDAHNGEGGPQQHGLSILRPGGSLSRHCRFELTASQARTAC